MRRFPVGRVLVINDPRAWLDAGLLDAETRRAPTAAVCDEMNIPGNLLSLVRFASLWTGACTRPLFSST